MTWDGMVWDGDEADWMHTRTSRRFMVPLNLRSTEYVLGLENGNTRLNRQSIRGPDATVASNVLGPAALELLARWAE